MTTSGSTKRRSDVGSLAQRLRDAEPRYGNRLSASLRLCALVLLTVGQATADWPFERGDQSSLGAVDFALPDEPALLWTYDSGGSALEATPVVADGVAYLGDADGTVHAVRVADGSSVWKRRFEQQLFLTAGGVADGALFVADVDGVVHCLATEDGAERWTFDVESETYGGPIVFHRAGAKLVLLPTESGQLIALDAASGEERWRFEIDAPLRCAATVVNGHALLAGCDGNLHTIDVATGEETGSVGIGGPTGNTAAVRNGVAYFGTEQGEFYAIDVSDPANPSVSWTLPRPQDAGRVSAPRRRWRPNRSVVYAQQRRKRSTRVNRPPTGEKIWIKPARAAGWSRLPLALAGNRTLVAATTRGRLHAAQHWPTGDDGLGHTTPAADSPRRLASGIGRPTADRPTPTERCTCFGARE